MEKISKVFMVKYIDPGTGQEYFLNADDRKALTGYYFTSDPYPAMFFAPLQGVGLNGSRICRNGNENRNGAESIMIITKN